jgi:hypothetical protein
MPQNGSFRLKYVGRRFDEKRLPVDVLTDLPAFRELLVAYAKAEWRRLNVHRKRVPRGFDASLAFDLIAIEDGSAVPVLKWNREITQARLPGFTDQIEDVVQASFKEVVDLFANAARGRFPSALGPEQIRGLNKFGSNLRDDERIEFEGTRNSEGNVVYLTALIRKSLIGSLRDRYVTQIEDIGKLLGCLVNREEGKKGHIVVQTDNHGELQVPIDNETIRSDFDGSIGQPVELNLEVELDHEDRVTGVIDVRNASVIDEQIAAQLKRCRDRVDQLTALQDGWHDGDGKRLSQNAIDAANRFLSQRSGLCHLYKIYPTDDGGIVLEIDTGVWDLSVEFLHDGKVRFYGIEIEGDRTVGITEFDTIDDQFLAQFDNFTK